NDGFEGSPLVGAKITAGARVVFDDCYIEKLVFFIEKNLSKPTAATVTFNQCAIASSTTRIGGNVRGVKIIPREGVSVREILHPYNDVTTLLRTQLVDWSDTPTIVPSSRLPTKW